MVIGFVIKLKYSFKASCLLVAIILAGCSGMDDYTTLDKATTLEKVNNGLFLELVNKKYLSDIDVVKAAIKRSGHNIRHARPPLKKNRKLAFLAIRQNPNALKFVDRELRGDKELVLISVSHYGRNLHLADKELKKDREVVLAAIENYAQALSHADDNLKKDEEIVMAALKAQSSSLQYADATLRDNDAFILRAIEETPMAIRWASERLRADKSMVIEAVKRDDAGATLSFLHESLKTDEDVLRALCDALTDASKELYGNRKVLRHCSDA